jgi:membrane protein required for colicin V production
VDSLPINLFDLGVIIVLVLGALVGLALGFVKAGLFVVSWLGAIAATILGWSTARPYAHRFIETDWLADLSAGLAIFLVTLIVLFLVSSFIGSWVRNSRLNALDRSLGMLAGLATAALIVVGGVMLMDSVRNVDEQPAWMRDAKSMPVIRAGADWLNDIIRRRTGFLGGESSASRAESRTNPMRTMEKLIQPAPRQSGERDDGGYDNKQRRELDRLIQSNPGPSDP